MQEAVPARTIAVDLTFPVLGVGFVLLALLVVALVTILLASKRRRDASS